MMCNVQSKHCFKLVSSVLTLRKSSSLSCLQSPQLCKVMAMWLGVKGTLRKHWSWPASIASFQWQRCYFDWKQSFYKLEKVKEINRGVATASHVSWCVKTVFYVDPWGQATLPFTSKRWSWSPFNLYVMSLNQSSGGKSFRSKLLGIKSVFHCQPNLNTVRKSHRITFTQEQKFDAIVLIVPLNKLLVYTGALLVYLGDKMVVTTEWPSVL